MNMSNEDFEAWHREELSYLKECVLEPDSIILVVQYVGELQKLQFAK